MSNIILMASGDSIAYWGKQLQKELDKLSWAGNTLGENGLINQTISARLFFTVAHLLDILCFKQLV